MESVHKRLFLLFCRVSFKSLLIRESVETHPDEEREAQDEILNHSVVIPVLRVSDFISENPVVRSGTTE